VVNRLATGFLRREKLAAKINVLPAASFHVYNRISKARANEPEAA
jgi:hypothetical protein